LFGLLNDQAAKFDANFVDTLHNHLFEFKLQDGTPIAVDLAATNINRGRDHGIPSYNAYRERCGLKRALKFDDLIDTINGTEISKLAQIYELVFVIIFVIFWTNEPFNFITDHQMILICILVAYQRDHQLVLLLVQFLVV
jgi:peroxidase